MTKRAQLFIAATIASGCILLASSLWEEGSDPSAASSPLPFGAARLRPQGAPARPYRDHLGEFRVRAHRGCIFTFPKLSCWRPWPASFNAYGGPPPSRLVQVSFNVATLAVSGGAAFRVSHRLSGAGDANLAVLLTVATCFYFAANTMLISGVLSLVEGKSLFQVWQQCYIWSLPYYLVGAVIAGVVVSTGRAMGWEASLLILPLAYLVYLFYRMCTQRIVAACTPATRSS